jgi:hypothetical protein
MLNFQPTTAAESVAHGHGLRTTSGYVVRRTWFDGRMHEDAGTFSANEYSQALQLAQAVREEQGADGYAVIDHLYICGCRGLG